MKHLYNALQTHRKKNVELTMVCKSQASNSTKIQGRFQSCVYVCVHVFTQQQRRWRHTGAHIVTNA